jgi:hypothetical protein
MSGINKWRPQGESGRAHRGKKRFLFEGAAIFTAFCLLIPVMPAGVYRAAAGDPSWEETVEVDNIAELRNAINESVGADDHSTPTAIMINKDISLGGSAVNIPAKAQIKLTSVSGYNYAIDAAD